MSENTIEQLEIENAKQTKEQEIEIAKGLEKSMTLAADELAKVTNSKILIVFFSEELQQAGSFASSNLSPLEERGLVTMANK